MAANIVTVEDLEAFRKKLVAELVSIFSNRVGAPQRQWLKSNEVQRLLMVSPNTLQMMRDKYNLAYTKIGGVIYYAYADIVKMLEENKISTPEAPEKLPAKIRAKVRKRS